MAEKETSQDMTKGSVEPAKDFSVFTEEEKKSVLPRKLGDRLLAFVLSYVLIGFFALQLVRLENENPRGWLRKSLHALAIEVMFTFCIFSALASIWALFTAGWLESSLNRRVPAVLTTIAVVLAAAVFTALYYTL